MSVRLWSTRQQHGRHPTSAQILQIERVQRTFTKRVPGCHHLAYHERLVKLRLQSLEHRRLIADLVMCFNIVHNLNCLNITDIFNLNSNKSLRGHSLKIGGADCQNKRPEIFYCKSNRPNLELFTE